MFLFSLILMHIPYHKRKLHQCSCDSVLSIQNRHRVPFEVCFEKFYRVFLRSQLHRSIFESYFMFKIISKKKETHRIMMAFSNQLYSLSFIKVQDRICIQPKMHQIIFDRLSLFYTKHCNIQFKGKMNSRINIDSFHRNSSIFYCTVIKIVLILSFNESSCIYFTSR